MTDVRWIGNAVICARAHWNRTGIILESGNRYRFIASGKWVDFFLTHGPGGDPSKLAYMRLFERYRRVPGADWFALIGSLDCDPSASFIIGESRDVDISRTGELTCFANDVNCMYWNNWGHVQLRVEQISGQ